MVADRRLAAPCLLLLLLALLGSDRARAQDAATADPAGIATYVGLAEDGQTFVALVVDGGDARAYACDGAELSHWLTGGAGAELDLRGEDGARLAAGVDQSVARGELILPDGRRLAFVAEVATGIAGLYEVTLDADGRLVGTASDGRRLVGGVALELADGGRLLAAVIEHSDGTGRAVAVVATVDAPADQRWIVVADGQVAGSHSGGANYRHFRNYEVK